VLTDETAALRAEQALAGRLTALATALAEAVAAASGSGGSGSGSGAGSGSGGGSGSGAAGSAGRAAQPVSAAQLAADQAAADAAAAQVTVAQQNLAAATVVSPVTGTVLSVTAVPGAQAAAGQAEFVVAGLDSYEVTADVAVTDLPQLRAGEHVTVLPDGQGSAISGVITQIGLTPDSTGSPVTYPVTISLTGHYSGLHAGDFASVTITTSRGRGVSVPTSALHYAGTSATVLVDDGGRVRTVRVTAGTKGPVLTQVTRGLRAGQQVVLATLNAPLPSDNDPGAGGPGPGGRRFINLGQ
jgi:RND family efflux transporter MFP subunit